MNKSTSTFQLAQSKQFIIAALLMFIMILTRGNITAHIQDASWAIFFLVGFYLRSSLLSRYAFPFFFLLAFVIDLIVIDAQGGTHYCFTASYPFLIPSYAALWFAGRLFAGKYQENMSGLVNFIGLAFIGVVVCFLVSNLGFYYFAGKFEAMSLMQYSQSVAKYLPAYLSTTGTYLGFFALLHLSIVHGRKLQNHVHS